ncbi:hypothetical protein [Ralstonia pseudosolanacearum]|uniref:hypothetical protein n=1 Tax=Ralstonia pseudosolanacearum TaxID=1310165 RepID=UPI003CF2C511
MKINRAVAGDALAETGHDAAHDVQERTYKACAMNPTDTRAFAAFSLSETEVAAILRPATDAAQGHALT